MTIQHGGNLYPKYQSKNPLVKLIMKGFMDRFRHHVSRSAASRILEVGCGEGELLKQVVECLADAEVMGMDIDEKSVTKAAKACPQAGIVLGDAHCLPFEDRAFDLVIACEVLEHLHSPEVALEQMRRVCQGELICSVPNEPLWRILNFASFRHFRYLGNTPGHIQHWNRNAFCRLIGKHFEVLSVGAPVPWLMITAKPR